MTATVAEKLSALMTYSEPFFPRWFNSMSDEDKDLFMSYKQRFDVFGMVMQSFGPWGRLSRPDEISSLPLIERMVDGPVRDHIPDQLMNVSHYRDFLEPALEHGEHALELYRQLRDKYSET